MKKKKLSLCLCHFEGKKTEKSPRKLLLQNKSLSTPSEGKPIQCVDVCQDARVLPFGFFFGDKTS